MSENLKVTHYNDGTEVLTGYSNSEWDNLSTGAYAVYEDNESSADTYGYLYNWYAGNDDRGVCPESWHVPTDDEIKQLEMYLGMIQEEADVDGWRGTNEGSKLAGRADLWVDGDLENNSEFGTSGFTGLPGGYRYYEGSYGTMGGNGFFWSSTEGSSSHAWDRTLDGSNSGISRGYSNKKGGFSVRCLADEITTGTILVPQDYSTIQAGIDAAFEGDTVLVSAGTYYENIIWASTNGIKLIGSGEDDCFIDGNQQESVIRFEEDLGGIIDSTTLIAGFTIQNGLAIHFGGGMLLFESSPTLTDVIFSDNSASTHGGGMYLYSSSPTLTSVTFSDNTAEYDGGGMCLINSSPTLTNVTFSDNTADGLGGGMALYDASNPTLTGVTFSGNTATHGGGMYLYSSSPTLTSVTFSDNTADSGGGMILSNTSNATLIDVTFSGNIANNGGGMYLYQSSPTLTNVTFNGNTAERGGGMDLDVSAPTLTGVTFIGNSAVWGGGMYISHSNPTLTGVTFIGNSADRGGGMYINDFNPNFESSNPTLTNIIFSGNNAVERGGGIYFASCGAITLTNVIFSDNTAQFGGGIYTVDSELILIHVTMVDNYANLGTAIYINPPTNLTTINSIMWDNIPGNPLFMWGLDDVTYSDIQGGWSGEGNIDADPLFCDAENGDFTVQSDSPVLGAGQDGTDMGAYGVGCESSDVSGCTDMEASNYNPDATEDDGSCASSCIDDPPICIWFSDIYDNQEECEENGGIWIGYLDFWWSGTYAGCEEIVQTIGCDQNMYYNEWSVSDLCPASCGECDIIQNCLDLHEGNNLISLSTLPSNGLLDISECIDGILGEGTAAFNDSSSWMGSLTEFSCEDGYWFHNNCEDFEWCYTGTECSDPLYSLHIGKNLISYPLSECGHIEEVLPDDVQDCIVGIVGEGNAALNNRDQWSGSLQTLCPDEGYWVLSDCDIDFMFIESVSLARQQELSPSPYPYNQSSSQAFYFFENIENIQEGDWILSFNGDKVIGAREWQGSTIDVPAMGDDGSYLTAGYIEAGSIPTFKLLSGGKLTNLEGDIPAFANNELYMVASLSEAIALPETFNLDRAYPNPFNPVTTLRFSLPVSSQISLTIYNLQGREIISLVDGNLDAGYHSVIWNADVHSSGVYFVKMIAGEYVNTQKLMLVK